MQGTSMEGPFPLSFSTLMNLKELRVSDLKGGIGTFPPLQNMKKMHKLVLRNLSLSGELPQYIAEMRALNTLDLSFNNLSGSIPARYEGLTRNLTKMYLTNNKFTGTIPSWILTRSTHQFDISYNSFTGLPAPSLCQQGTVNLASSYSSTNSKNIKSCLQRNLPCSEEAINYHFFINCGGDKEIIDGNEYEADTIDSGASNYVPSENRKWAYSSTGDFLDNKGPYVVANKTALNISKPELYMTARLSPLSLKYYAFCMYKGNYTIGLHFAEIVFTDDETYSSNGRRMFDVSIQGEKVLQDFDIAKEANGTGREIIKYFTVMVDGTLEIHFYWAGKGTNSVPDRGVYGPLISAISVRPDFKIPTNHKKLTVGAILAIVASACLVFLLILCLILWYFWRRDSKNDGKGKKQASGVLSFCLL